MQDKKRVLEVSAIKFDEATGQVSYEQTRYDVTEGTPVDVRSFGQQVICELDGTPKKFDAMPTTEEVIAFAESREIKEEVDETVYSDTTTTPAA